MSHAEYDSGDCTNSQLLKQVDCVKSSATDKITIMIVCSTIMTIRVYLDSRLSGFSKRSTAEYLLINQIPGMQRAIKISAIINLSTISHQSFAHLFSYFRLILCVPDQTCTLAIITN